MREDTKQAESVCTKIRKLLYNIDLTIVWAKGEMSVCKNIMNRYRNDNRKFAQRKFINAKVDKERFKIMIEDLENTKKETLDNLDNMLSKYQPRYKKIFVLFFIEKKTYEEIAQETQYSKDAIKYIIQKLKEDLLTYYLP